LFGLTLLHYPIINPVTHMNEVCLSFQFIK